MRLTLLILALALAACGGDARQVEIVGNTMGTQYSVKLPRLQADHDVANLEKSIDTVLDVANAQMSTYLDDSELSLFNASESVEWQQVSADLCKKIEASQALSRLTDGAFDITVGPLVNLWGFGPGEMIDEPPGEDAIAALLEVTGYENLHTDCYRYLVRKDLPGLMLDLSAVGKGFAADQVGLLLTSIGYEDFLVEVGGELSVRGQNAKGEPWAIGIEAPLPNQRRPHTVVKLTNVGMATSGDYRNFFEADGKIYSHTIDTRTGRPVTHTLASVTVVDKLASRADALATALLVMGPEEGMAFAEREQLAVLMLIRTDGGIEERQTAAFAELRDIT
ncbi:MAG: FAD:protein FMN transferase [Woeseiaceae bacterium]|nr:FAD:protein FMN transferase [Woeseiaceae bacterium]